MFMGFKSIFLEYLARRVKSRCHCVPLLPIMHDTIRDTSDLIGPGDTLVDDLLEAIEVLNAALWRAVEIADSIDRVRRANPVRCLVQCVVVYL